MIGSMLPKANVACTKTELPITHFRTAAKKTRSLLGLLHAALRGKSDLINIGQRCLWDLFSNRVPKLQCLAFLGWLRSNHLHDPTDPFLPFRTSYQVRVSANRGAWRLMCVGVTTVYNNSTLERLKLLCGNVLFTMLCSPGHSMISAILTRKHSNLDVWAFPPENLKQTWL